jgi:hypothetical protein
MPRSPAPGIVGRVYADRLRRLIATARAIDGLDPQVIVLSVDGYRAIGLRNRLRRSGLDGVRVVPLLPRDAKPDVVHLWCRSRVGSAPFVVAVYAGPPELDDRQLELYDRLLGRGVGRDAALALARATDYS